MLAHVADNLGVVAALGEEQAVVIGHDWGSPIAAASALLRPDVFRAVGLLSVPYSRPGRTRPTEAFRRLGGDEEFYINYFQQPGRAEAEIEADVRSWLLGFYVAASGDGRRPPDGGTFTTVAPGGALRDRFVIPEHLPAWLGEDDLDTYVGQFEQTGFTGGLNRYRNIDRDWEDLQVWADRPIGVPAVFVGGERDGPTIWGARPSPASTAPCRRCGGRTCSPAAGTGSSRNGRPRWPTSSSGFSAPWAEGERARGRRASSPCTPDAGRR